MTANEFLENVNDYYGLKEFCSEIGCEYCDDIVDDNTLDEDVEYDLTEYCRDYDWREIRDLLNDIPTGYDWYRCRGLFDYVGLDDSDFEDSKDEVYEWAFNNGYFDDEMDENEECDDEVVEDDLYEEPDKDPVEDEDFSVSDLMSMCSVTLITIQKDSVHRAQESEAALNQYINVNIPKVLK